MIHDFPHITAVIRCRFVHSVTPFQSLEDCENIIFVKGKVQNTIPGIVPDQISLLRLDTDWYDSTYHEMRHLFPVLQKSGVLVLDDYGFWEGARRAVDQYFAESQDVILLTRIDFSGRIGIKI